MANTGTSSPGALQKKIDALEAGTKKDIVGNAKVTVAGVAMTAVQILAKLGTADTLYAAVLAARTALKQALAAYEAAVPGLKLFIKNYDVALKTQFGVDNVLLSDFGIKPASPKAPPRTAAEKAVSSALATNTRKVRGPTGKARAAITTEGKPGLVLVSPTGTPIPNGIMGPTPPGSATPVDAAANLAPVGGSAAGSSTPSAAPAATTPNGGAASPASGSNTPAQ